MNVLKGGKRQASYGSEECEGTISDQKWDSCTYSTRVPVPIAKYTVLQPAEEFIFGFNHLGSESTCGSEEERWFCVK